MPPRGKLAPSSDGPVVCDFIETFLRVTKGRRAGDAIALRDWQRELLISLYELRTDGRRRFRRGLIGMPRKNGKSALGAGLALYGLFDEPGAEVYCLDESARVLCDDLVWRAAGDLSVSDGVLGFDEHAGMDGKYRKLRATHVTSTRRIQQPTFRIRLLDGREVISSATHRWLARSCKTSNYTQWVETQQIQLGTRIRDLGPTWERDDSRDGGYLAGIYDGEGWVVGGTGTGYRRGAVVSFAQKPGAVLDASMRMLEERGFAPKVLTHAKSGVHEVKLTGLVDCLRLLGSLQPVRLIQKVPTWLDGMTPNRVGEATVVAVEPLGEREVVAIGTGSKTLFVEGLFSHNSCAGDKEQARIVFTETKRAVEADPELSSNLRVYKDAIELPATHSVYRVLSAEAYTKEGLNPSLVLFDEVHVQPNDELWNVMSLGSGTRDQPLLLGITTAGVKYDTTGAESLCYRLWRYGQSVLKGEVDDPAFFMRWWGAPDSADHTDPDVWRDANPALGDFLHVEDFESTIRTTPENEFRTKRLNQWVSAQSAWLPAGAWEACADTDTDVHSGTEIVLGFDGSFNGDSTALVGCTTGSSPHVFVVECWEKPELVDDDWQVPIVDVEQAIRDACKRWRVREIACDPYRWARSMQVLEAERLPVVEFPQNQTRMTPATTRFYEAVVNNSLTHDGDKRLARHIGNAVLKTDSRGSRLSKDRKGSARRIDLAVCAVMALERSQHAQTQREFWGSWA